MIFKNRIMFREINMRFIIELMDIISNLEQQLIEKIIAIILIQKMNESPERSIEEEMIIIEIFNKVIVIITSEKKDH